MTQPVSDIGALTARLRPTAQKIEQWRAEAAKIRQLRQTAVETSAVTPEILLGVEEIAGQIYVEIATFDALVAEVETVSPQSAAELGAVGDALRLVLLEITELGTDMYGVTSHTTEASVETSPPPVEAS